MTQGIRTAEKKENNTHSARYFRLESPYILGILICVAIPCLCLVGWKQQTIPGWFAAIFSTITLFAAGYCAWILTQKRPVIQIDTSNKIIRFESVALPTLRWEISFESLRSIELEYEAGTTLRLLTIGFQNPSTKHLKFLRFNLVNVDVEPPAIYELMKRISEKSNESN